MPAIKDKCIVIPLDQKDVTNTVESLPRLPSESGIIDIQWKRRLGQKNAHLQAKVDPMKMFQVIQFFKDSGNPHYTNLQTREEYETRCQNEDPEGYQLLFGPHPNSKLKLKLEFIEDGFSDPILDLNVYKEIKQLHESEQEYREEDVIRKYQM